MGPLHASEMSLYLRCPRAWSHAYVDRRVAKETDRNLSIGTQVHKWLQEWWILQNWLVYPEDPIARACCIGYHAYWGEPDLKNVEVELPWSAEVGGVPCAGTLDAIGTDDDGHVVIVEHKTTGHDITPGSVYWRQRVTADVQVSMYLAAFPDATVVYDVIRKPSLRLKKDETEDQFVTRCVVAMADEPDKYFQRQTVVRLEHEHKAFAEDVRLIDDRRRLPFQPRATGACFDYGKRCPYWGVCFEGEDINGPEFQENTHGRQ